MPNPDTRPHAEIKRLSKSVKRRRNYADNLKRSAIEIRNDMPTDDELAFAARLVELADSELAKAREEERASKEIKERNQRPSYADFSSAEMKERAERAMAAVRGRLTIDRIQHMLAELGRPEDRPTTGEGMATIEKLLGIEHLGDRPQLGVRVQLAETRMFGAPRF